MINDSIKTKFLTLLNNLSTFDQDTFTVKECMDRLIEVFAEITPIPHNPIELADRLLSNLLLLSLQKEGAIYFNRALLTSLLHFHDKLALPEYAELPNAGPAMAALNELYQAIHTICIRHLRIIEIKKQSDCQPFAKTKINHMTLAYLNWVGSDAQFLESQKEKKEDLSPEYDLLVAIFSNTDILQSLSELEDEAHPAFIEGPPSVTPHFLAIQLRVFEQHLNQFLSLLNQQRQRFHRFSLLFFASFSRKKTTSENEATLLMNESVKVVEKRG